ACLSSADAGAVTVSAAVRSQKVVVHVTFAGPSIGPKEAAALEESLVNGGLRRAALRECSKQTPPAHAVRQFLLRRVTSEVYWVVGRHEWRLPFSHRLHLNGRHGSSVIVSEPFDFAGGRNLTLHLHPRGFWRPGRHCDPHDLASSSAALTLSAAGNDLPRLQFLLSAGRCTSSWVGPYGREGQRFCPGGQICSLEELGQAMDSDGTLTLVMEAVEPAGRAEADVRPLQRELQAADVPGETSRFPPPLEVTFAHRVHDSSNHMDGTSAESQHASEPGASWPELCSLEASLARLRTELQASHEGAVSQQLRETCAAAAAAAEGLRARLSAAAPPTGAAASPKGEAPKAEDPAREEAKPGAEGGSQLLGKGLAPGSAEGQHSSDASLLEAVSDTKSRVEAIAAKMEAVEAAVAALQATETDRSWCGGALEAKDAPLRLEEASRVPQAELGGAQAREPRSPISPTADQAFDSSGSRQLTGTAELETCLAHHGADLSWEVRLWDNTSSGRILRRPLLTMGRMNSGSTADLNTDDF
ncbi:unnamed protein product, partial [Polarella glacialis]